MDSCGVSMIPRRRARRYPKSANAGLCNGGSDYGNTAEEALANAAGGIASEPNRSPPARNETRLRVTIACFFRAVAEAGALSVGGSSFETANARPPETADGPAPTWKF
jgi:hypothetical protein